MIPLLHYARSVSSTETLQAHHSCQTLDERPLLHSITGVVAVSLQQLQPGEVADIVWQLSHFR